MPSGGNSFLSAAYQNNIIRKFITIFLINCDNKPAVIPLDVHLEYKVSTWRLREFFRAVSIFSFYIILKQINVCTNDGKILCSQHVRSWKLWKILWWTRTRRSRAGSTKSIVNGVPILYPPTAREHNPARNGVQVVQEKLSLYFTFHFDMYVRFIAGDKYFERKMPNPPLILADATNPAIMARWKVSEIFVAEVIKEGLRRDNDKVSWFSTILIILSQAPKDLVEAEDDWNDVLENQSPLRLWRLIEKTHLAKITGSTDIDRDNAMEEYNAVRQEKNESLADYKKRFERTVRALERVRHTAIPDERMQVTKWIRGLNSKYQEWKIRTINEMQEGSRPPASLEEAMRSVRNYVSNQTQSDHRDKGHLSTVFVAEGQRDGDKDKKPSTKQRRKSPGNRRSRANLIR